MVYAEAGIDRQRYRCKACSLTTSADLRLRKCHYAFGVLCSSAGVKSARQTPCRDRRQQQRLSYSAAAQTCRLSGYAILLTYVSACGCAVTSAIASIDWI